jgi:hypothetical protein
MNILVAYRGIPHNSGWATGDSLVRAFRRLGHNAQPYGRYYSQPGPDGKGQELCGRPLGPVPHSVDLLVCLECGDSDPWYGELAALNCPKVYWEYDTPLHPVQTLEWLKFMQFSHVFMANPEWATKFGATYLPYAVDDQLFRSANRPRGGAAIIGTPFPERVTFAQKAGVEIISGIYGQDYAAKLRELRTHVHHHASGGEGLLVMRIFETMGSGALLLTEHDPTLYKHFAPNKHCVTYANADDCRMKLQWIDNNRDKAAEMAKAGYDIVTSKHTYVCRARAILASLT